jgi:hypothetical protein
MSTLYGDHSTGFGPRDAVADRLAEVRAKQPRKHFAHQEPLEYVTAGPAGDTAATLGRPPTVEYAAPVVAPPVFPHHNAGNSAYAAGVRYAEKQSAVLASTPPIRSGAERNAGDEIAALKARLAVLEASQASTAASTPKAAPAPQQPTQSVQQMIDAAQARSYREAVEFANRSAVKPIGLKG